MMIAPIKRVDRPMMWSSNTVTCHLYPSSGCRKPWQILPQVVRRAGLQGFAVAHHVPSIAYVCSAPANRSEADLRPGITGIAASCMRKKSVDVQHLAGLASLRPWYVPVPFRQKNSSSAGTLVRSSQRTTLFQLINEEVTAIRLDPLGKGMPDDGFRRRAHYSGSSSSFAAADSDDRQFWREAGNVGLLFSRKLCGIKRKSGIQVSSGFETPIKGVLDLFPQSSPIRSHDHAPAYRGIISQFSPENQLVVPFGKICGTWRKFTFGHIVRLFFALPQQTVRSKADATSCPTTFQRCLTPSSLTQITSRTQTD